MMTMWSTCARRGAIVAALCGGGVAALAAADICAGAMVRAGSACMGYLWSGILFAVS